MNILKFSLLCLLTISLSACFNGDDGNANSATALSNVAADGDPLQITDPSTLKQDFADLFGNADDDPLDVEMDDTIQTIVDRNVRIES